LNPDIDEMFYGTSRRIDKDIFPMSWRHVRFTQKQASPLLIVMSALPPKADID
jgi:hypothetical protein